MFTFDVLSPAVSIFIVTTVASTIWNSNDNWKGCTTISIWVTLCKKSKSMVDNGQKKINRTLEKQQNKVIGLIDKVLEDLSQEIKARKKGLIESNEVPSILQLESISNELIKMKRVLSPINYYPTYTRQIVDS